MTAKRDPDGLIRTFLAEGLTELPDRSFDAVRIAIDRTRQRTAIGPWRNTTMTTSVRLMAAAAAFAVAVAGLALIFVPPGPATSPAPSPNHTSSADPTFVPSDTVRYQWPRSLGAGRYATTMAWDLPFTMSFTLPSGWESRDVEVIKGDMSVSLQVPWDLFVDPCSDTSATIDTGGTAATFANALAQVRGLEVGAPQAGTYAGRDGMSVTYRATDLACVGESSRLWSNAAWTIMPVEPLGPPWWPVRAGLHQVWVLDVDGRRIAIDSTAGANPTSGDQADLQAVLDSITFGRPTEQLQLGSCQVQLHEPGRPSVTVRPGDVVRMANATVPVLGAAPVDLFGPPYAAVELGVTNITGSGPSEGRPMISVVPPPGSPHGGFGTMSTAPEGDGLVGTLLLDTPGTWWVRISILSQGCIWQQPILVAAG